MGRKDRRKQNKNKRSSLEKRDTIGLIDGGASVPEEIVLNILKRLPVKSLLRFRCVRKDWLALIDNPFFVHTHFSCSVTRPQGCQILISFSNFEGSEHYFYTLSLLGGKATWLLSLPGCNKGTNSPCHCWVSESFHGLVCFYNGNQIFVFNPNTKNVMRNIPTNSVSTLFPKHFLIPYSKYYFGFNPSTEEHKLLHIFGNRHVTNTIKLFDVQCEVLAIKANLRETKGVDFHSFCWRKLPQVPPYPYIFKSQGVCVNGVMHWISIAPRQDIIVAFNLASDTFYSISLPNSCPINSLLTQIGDHLALLNCEDAKNAYIDLWVLKDNQNSLWVKKRVVSWQKQKRGKGAIVIGTALTGEFFMVSSILPYHYDLVPFNHRKKAVKTIRVAELPPWMDLPYAAGNCNFNITNHVQSLMPLPQTTLQFGDFVVNLDG